MPISIPKSQANRLPLAFQPVGVVAGVGAVPVSQTFPPISVRVTTSLTADRELLRGPTGPELAAVPEPIAILSSWFIAIFVLGLTILAMLLLRWRPRRERPPNWSALAAGPMGDVEFATRLVHALRTWGRDLSEPTVELARLIMICDRARFAGRDFGIGERDEVAISATKLLARSPPPG